MFIPANSLVNMILDITSVRVKIIPAMVTLRFIRFPAMTSVMLKVNEGNSIDLTFGLVRIPGLATQKNGWRMSTTFRCRGRASLILDDCLKKLIDFKESLVHSRIECILLSIEGLLLSPPLLAILERFLELEKTGTIGHGNRAGEKNLGKGS